MKAAIEEERDKFKLPRSILPNRVCVCVCLSAWCVSDLLVVRVCMCVCTFNSMLLYDFFFSLFSGESVTLWLYQKGLGI